MSGVEVDAPELPQGRRRRPSANASVVDLTSESLEADTGLGFPDEVLVPGVHLMQGRRTPPCEGSHQVQRRAGCVVGAEQPLRVEPPGLRLERLVVDPIAEVRGQRHLTVGLVGFDRGLKLLPGHPPDLHHRHPTTRR